MFCLYIQGRVHLSNYSTSCTAKNICLQKARNPKYTNDSQHLNNCKCRPVQSSKMKSALSQNNLIWAEMEFGNSCIRLCFILGRHFFQEPHLQLNTHTHTHILAPHSHPLWPSASGFQVCSCVPQEKQTRDREEAPNASFKQTLPLPHSNPDGRFWFGNFPAYSCLGTPDLQTLRLH